MRIVLLAYSFLYAVNGYAREVTPFEKIIGALNDLSTISQVPQNDVIYLQYKDETVPLKKSAFTSFVQQIITFEDEASGQCPHCNHDSHDTKLKLSSLLKQKTVEMSAFVYKGLKQYGLPYAVFLIVFETVEHTVFAWLPPLCPLYHAGYFAVDNFVRKFKTLGATGTGLTFSERAKILGTSIYLDVILWSPLRQAAKQQSAVFSELPNGFNLKDEIEFIFSDEPKGQRYWTAKSQVKGFQLLSEYLSGLVSERLSHGEITSSQAFSIFGILGKTNKKIQKYMDFLRLYSLTNNPDKFFDKKTEAEAQLNGLLEFFTDAQKLLTQNGDFLDQAIIEVAPSCEGSIFRLMSKR